MILMGSFHLEILNDSELLFFEGLKTEHSADRNLKWSLQVFRKHKHQRISLLWIQFYYLALLRHISTFKVLDGLIFAQPVESLNVLDPDWRCRFFLPGEFH